MHVDRKALAKAVEHAASTFHPESEGQLIEALEAAATALREENDLVVLMQKQADRADRALYRAHKCDCQVRLRAWLNSFRAWKSGHPHTEDESDD